MGAKTRKLSQINDSIIEWQSVVVADGSTGLTAVAGRGYFINTTAGAITVTTPASPKQGDKIVIVDYAGTFATNNVTINFNGAKVFGSSNTSTLQTNYQVVDLIYIDNTQGWRTVNQDTTSDIQSALFITATGGTVTTDGNFKIHTFTGDGTFVVSQVGNSPTTPLGGPSSVDYLVVAGGGSAGSPYGGGGGAGGFREGRVLPAPESYTASPLVAPGGLAISVQTYPVTVGAGAAGIAVPNVGLTGSNSIFSTITSAGGGGGGKNESGPFAGTPGGSGGGGGGSAASHPAGGAGGTGNTPPVSPPQGNPGGTGSGPGQYGAAGGGGAGSAGNQGNSTPTGSGGNGAGTGINPSPSVGTPGPSPTLRYFAGGGADYAFTPGSGGGFGGGGGSGNAGTANTGGGGGAEGATGAGGKGIVIIRYKFQ